MRMQYDSSLKANLLRDDDDRLCAINHHDEFPTIEANDAREAALQYLRNVAGNFDIDAGEIENAGQRLSFLDPEPRGSEFRLRDEKRQFDTATFVFNQTYLNLPVWTAGVTVTLKEAPWRVLASTNTSRRGIDAKMPSNAAIEMFRKLFATGEKVDQPQHRPQQPDLLSRGDAEVIRSQRATRGAAKAGPSTENENGAAAAAEMLGDFETATRTPLAERRYGLTGLISGRFYVYQYDAADRLDPRTDDAPRPEVRNPPTGKQAAQGGAHSHDDGDQPLCGTPPRFPGPIPPVANGIRDGGWYVVAELVFRRPAEGSRMNWRALVDVESGSILYLRALASGITGYVFEHDPITTSGNTMLTPNQNAATLNPSRVSRTLNNLNAPVAMTQSLSGSRTFVTETSAPTVAAPTRPSGSNFDIYSSRSNDFAAVNAYFHTDRFFALVENLGFSLATYFNGTTFPIETDHRGLGSIINAQCIGDGDGIDFHQYALADTGDTTNPIGIATDWRVILHELGGHGILYDHVNFANFGFSHSAGDSLAVILNDPASAWHSGAALDRFILAPFVPAIPRFSNRGIAEQSVAGLTLTSGGSGYTSPPTVTVTGGGGTGATAVVPNWAVSGGQVTAVFVARPGRNFTSVPTISFSGGGGTGAAATATLGTWGWGAGMDQAGYLSEEILSTTLFRVYRSLGGDSSELVRRQFAARATAYLILRAVGTLTPASNPSTPAQFLNALVAADAGDWTSEGLAGGAYNKVLRWAFEKQNLNGGARPAVDVYINDGRNGEYPHQPVHWANVSVWNRLSPDDMEGHQNAAVGVTNYAYCKVRNRGTSIANSVIVRGYHCLPSAGVTWPTDMQPMTTASISVGTVAANDMEEKIVGPFSWTPNANAWGHDCMMLIASATGDPSNVDLLSAGETYADSRLVPHDNNVGQRNVVLTGALDGLADIKASLQGKGFWIGNPERKAATVTATIALPPALERAGWKFGFRELPEGGFRMKPGERRLITFDIEAGAAIDRDAMRSDRDRDIVVTATANGAIIGGMVYRLDPDLAAPRDRAEGAKDSRPCREKAQALLDCLDMPKARVKCVKVRKVAVDLELDSDDCCD